ncbi:MAG: hemolysin family protein [Phycisphaerae bacterium]
MAALALSFYMSTLSFALRDYSRSQLADFLSEDAQQKWFPWLDRYGSILPLVTGAIRVVANMTFFGCVVGWYAHRNDIFDIRSDFLPPALITLAFLGFFALGIPHAIAFHTGEAVLARSIRLLWLLRLLAKPIIALYHGIEFVIRRLLGIAESNEEENTERAEKDILDAVTEGELHGAVDEEKREMIRSVFDLDETSASAIMTPRTDMIAIDVNLPPNEIKNIVIDAGHSRIPVYESSLDNILGVLYVKDLIGLEFNDALDLRTLLRDVPYVPESKTVDELLREFKQNKVHIAIILDEYGGTAGLITIEDILEEVVGEITDEYDEDEEPPIARIDGSTIEVDARVHVEDVNEELDIEIPQNGTYETIGGFVFTRLGKIPTVGESVQHEQIHIEVLDAEPRKINRLRVSVTDEDE